MFIVLYCNANYIINENIIIDVEPIETNLTVR